ncbi:C69 family dipeptidase [Streptococcus pneumoniae]
MQSKHIKGLIAATLFSTALLAAKPTEACSAFIIGKDLTEDGSYLFGRTEDYPFQNGNADHNKNFIVHEAQDYQPGEFQHDGDTGFTYEHAAHEYKYTSTPDAERGDQDATEADKAKLSAEEGFAESNLNGTYGAHGFNEHGVSMSATVTASPVAGYETGNFQKIEKVDPFTSVIQRQRQEELEETAKSSVQIEAEKASKDAKNKALTEGKTEKEAKKVAKEAAQVIYDAAIKEATDAQNKKDPSYLAPLGGLGESSMIDLVLPRVKTAREGIELIAKVLEEKGAYDGNVIMIGDKKELWYMEILSGHQYVAIKYPADKYSVFPNTWSLGSVDFNDKENVIASKDVEKIAKEAGSATYDKDGNFLIARSYGPDKDSPGNRSRAYAGIKLLDPDSPIQYNDDFYDLLRTPTNPHKKFSLQDVFNLQRNRFEHLPEFKPDDEAPKDLKYNRRIGHDVYKYALGNKNVINAHVYQINPNLPTEFGGIAWLGFGQTRNTPYVPYYGNITETPKEFHPQSTEYDTNSWYWTVQNIDKLTSEHYDLFGNTIQKRWKAIEELEIARQDKMNAFYTEAGLSPEQASRMVTADFLRLAETMFKEMKTVEKKLQAAIDGDKEALAWLQSLDNLPVLPEPHLYKLESTGSQPVSYNPPSAPLSHFIQRGQTQKTHVQALGSKATNKQDTKPLSKDEAPAVSDSSKSLPQTNGHTSSMIESLGLILLTLSGFFMKKGKKEN